MVEPHCKEVWAWIGVDEKSNLKSFDGLEKMTNIKAFKEVGNKYGFPVIEKGNYIVMKAGNTDGKLIEWIKYMPKSDTDIHYWQY